jgi:hypothetical protein
MIGRAVTPEAKGAIVERLLDLWKEHPSLRLGQLIANCFPGDIYYIEDENLIGIMEVRYRLPGGLVHHSNSLVREGE